MLLYCKIDPLKWNNVNVVVADDDDVDVVVDVDDVPSSSLNFRIINIFAFKHLVRDLVSAKGGVCH